MLNDHDDIEALREVIRITRDEISQIKDLDSLLDKILFETRKLTSADAGSIYLLEDGKLKFSYVQNDTLFKNDLLNNKFLYSRQEMPTNDKSIAGYVALSGESVVIEDAYKIAGVPYSFNPSFDRTSSYRTRSILAVPLKTGQGKVIGVM